MARKTPIIPLLATLLLVTLACNLPIGERAVIGPDATITAAIKTVEFQLTGSAVPTATRQFTETPRPTDTTVPTFTPRPPTITSIPPTAVTRCNWAQFVTDVTVPDGTRFAPGAAFTKTWRLKNIGTCTWTGQYYLAFVSGEAMGAPVSVMMPEIVPPGDTVDISVNLTAPASTGRKKGNWQLYNPAGVPFGIGWNAGGSFYVEIEVATSTVTPTATLAPGTVMYDFVAQYCSAVWRSEAGTLTCPGAIDDAEGFVMKVDAPQLENGDTKAKPGLWTHPQWIDNGAISGRFPAYVVQNGDHFRATLACLYNANACNVRFQLNYRADGGELKNFGQWDQVYDGSVQNLDLDLSPLAGKSVEFVLAVVTNGAADQDWAFWWQPRITR